MAYVIECLECEMPVKRLVSHVRSHGMTFEQYATKHCYGGIRPTCLCGCGGLTTFIPQVGVLYREYVSGHNWLGKQRSKENRLKLHFANAGERNPMFGKTYHHTEETKSLMSEIRIEYTRRNPQWNHGQNNPAWKGGLRTKYSGFGRDKKRQIRSRDGNKCSICACTERLQIHHIDYDKRNSSLENLTTLCASCHSKTNFKRKQWMQFFDRKMSAQ